MTIIIQSWGNLQTYWVRSGHLAEVSVCHIWMHGLSEPNAPCKSSTVARWDSKQKENWSRHTLPLASLAVPRQDILPLIVKWRSRIREQSLHSVLWCSAPESSAMEPVAWANWHTCTHTLLASTLLSDNQMQNPGHYYLFEPAGFLVFFSQF